MTVTNAQNCMSSFGDSSIKGFLSSHCSAFLIVLHLLNSWFNTFYLLKDIQPTLEREAWDHIDLIVRLAPTSWSLPQYSSLPHHCQVSSRVGESMCRNSSLCPVYHQHLRKTGRKTQADIMHCRIYIRARQL